MTIPCNPFLSVSVGMISGLQTIIIIYMGISRFCFYRDGRRRLECISAEKSPHTLSEIGEEMNLYRGPGSKPSMTYVPGCDTGNDAYNAMITRARRCNVVLRALVAITSASPSHLSPSRVRVILRHESHSPSLALAYLVALTSPSRRRLLATLLTLAPPSH